jgi:metal-dependent amidase/aminoacylase/carboxypeptidase family protein
MYQAGTFRGADILVRSHSASETRRDKAGFGVCCLNINSVKYTFTGRPAHQLTSWNGRNALEAAVQFYSAVDHLRSTWRPDHRVQGVIPEGGIAPNVVPDRAVVDYFIRFPDEVYLEHISRMMDEAAEGAAKMTDTKVDINRYGEDRDGITTGTLQELFFAYARKFGAPNIKDDARNPSGYEETGIVDRVIPGVGVRVQTSSAPNHTYEMEADNFVDIGHHGFMLDARLEAAVLYDFLTQPEFRRKVSDEERVLGGLQEKYLSALRRAYGPEIGADTALSKTSKMRIEIPKVERGH